MNIYMYIISVSDNGSVLDHHNKTCTVLNEENVQRMTLIVQWPMLKYNVEIYLTEYKNKNRVTSSILVSVLLMVTRYVLNDNAMVLVVSRMAAGVQPSIRNTL